MDLAGPQKINQPTGAQSFRRHFSNLVGSHKAQLASISYLTDPLSSMPISQSINRCNPGIIAGNLAGPNMVDLGGCHFINLPHVR